MSHCGGFPVQEFTQGDYRISTNETLLDAAAIHEYLSKRAYWALGRSLELVEQSLRNSLCYGVYQGSHQVGLARVITDFTVYAYLCDVYIHEDHRGQGLSKWLIASILEHPALNAIPRFSLATRDAQDLYRRFGFTEVEEPHRYMNRRPRPVGE